MCHITWSWLQGSTVEVSVLLSHCVVACLDTVLQSISMWSSFFFFSSLVSSCTSSLLIAWLFIVPDSLICFIYCIYHVLKWPLLTNTKAGSRPDKKRTRNAYSLKKKKKKWQHRLDICVSPPLFPPNTKYHITAGHISRSPSWSDWPFCVLQILEKFVCGIFL